MTPLQQEIQLAEILARAREKPKETEKYLDLTIKKTERRKK